MRRCDHCGEPITWDDESGTWFSPNGIRCNSVDGHSSWGGTIERLARQPESGTDQGAG